MVDTVFPFQVVLFTEHYSIAGGLFLHEQRLSDFLNDRRDTSSHDAEQQHSPSGGPRQDP